MDIKVMALLIPIIAILMGVGIGMLAIFLRYRKQKHMFELFHQERMAAIDKGIEPLPIPEEFFSDSGKPYSPHRPLLVGLICTLTGLGVLVAFYWHHPDMVYYALVPIGFGLAYLIYYFTVGRKQAEAIEAKRQAQSEGSSRAPAFSK
jgi:hypothetical protein